MLHSSIVKISKVHFTHIPEECISQILSYLDIPDQHSLLLTCNSLFHKVVPTLYRSPFRAIINFDGWSQSSFPPPPPPSTLSSPPQNTNHSSITTTNCSVGDKDIKNQPDNLDIFAPSSASSASSSTSFSSYNGKGTDSNTQYSSPSQAQSQKSTKRPASLQPRSYSDHIRTYFTASQSNNGSQVNSTTPAPFSQYKSASVSSSNLTSNVAESSRPIPNNNDNTTTTLEQIKLRKVARLLQLLIACTPVQTRLPALRYPGYGQRWVRPPLKDDYLRYYIDQQQGGEIMIRSFHLLFADLIRCQWNGDLQGNSPNEINQKTVNLPIPIAVDPPDAEAYKVLNQILSEFMNHNPAQIRTLSISAIHSIELAESLVPQMGAVTRLELTDLDLDQQQPMFKVDYIIDFVKSHRMLFGPVLTDISIVGKSSPSTSSSLLYPGSRSLPSPTLQNTTFESTIAAALSTRAPPSNENVKKINETIPLIFDSLRNVKTIDATGWADCILHLDRIIPPIKTKPVPTGQIASTLNLSNPSALSTTGASIPITASIKKLWLSFNFPPSQSFDSKPARLSEVLERCRNLEQVRVPIRRSDVFTWAMSEKKTSLICAPILANSKTKRLHRIKRLHLHGPVSDLLDCVHEAAFAFQDTLEDLEAQSILRVWQPTVRVWEGFMVNLKRLKLDGEVCLYFSLDSLKQCPALEELSLSLPSADAWIYHPHDQRQYPSSNGYRSKSNAEEALATPSPHHRAISRISELKKLKSLTLSGTWVISDRALRRIADKCHQLSKLCINQAVGMSIGGLLLGVENMQKLETLSLTLDLVDLHLIRVVIRPLVNLKSVQITSLVQ